MVATAAPRLSVALRGDRDARDRAGRRRRAREPDRAAASPRCSRSWPRCAGRHAAAGVARRAAGRRRLDGRRRRVYFALFWSTTGQTPGMRLMRLKVVDRTPASRRTWLRALLRVVGLGAGDHPAVRGLPTGALRRAPPRDPRSARGHHRCPCAGTADAIVTQPRCRATTRSVSGSTCSRWTANWRASAAHVGVLLARSAGAPCRRRSARTRSGTARRRRTGPARRGAR